MRIPKRFKLFGQTIEVVFDGKPFVESDGYNGFASYRTNRIEIRPSTEAQPRTQTQLEQTFCHELMHYIIYHSEAAITGKKDYPHQEEGFIELASHILHQALSTMEFGGGSHEPALVHGNKKERSPRKNKRKVRFLWNGINPGARKN